MMRPSNINLSPLLNLFRYSRGLCLTLLAILLFCIFGSILNRRQDYLQYLSSGSWPDLGQSRSAVIRPGDLVISESREVRPQDDQTPFAHEPIGLGTLRDVRCVAGHQIPNLCLY